MMQTFDYLVENKHRLKVTGIRPMAPVLNTGPLQGIFKVSEHENVKFFGKERNY